MNGCFVIKFDHNYSKFPEKYQSSLLLGVLQVDLRDVSNLLRVYDTAYLDFDGSVSHYRLPECGSYLLLLLLADNGVGGLWTTFRSNDPTKLSYYCNMIGRIVTCVVTDMSSKGAVKDASKKE